MKSCLGVLAVLGLTRGAGGWRRLGIGSVVVLAKRTRLGFLVLVLGLGSEEESEVFDDTVRL